MLGKSYLRGDVIISVDDLATGYLYEKCTYVNNLISCDEDSLRILATGDHVINKTGVYKYHSIDDAGNDTVKRDGYYNFQIDNTAPTLTIHSDKTGIKILLPQGGYTNAALVSIESFDNILEDEVKIEWSVTRVEGTSFSAWQLVSERNFITQEGYYKIIDAIFLKLNPSL